MRAAANGAVGPNPNKMTPLSYLAGSAGLPEFQVEPEQGIRRVRDPGCTQSRDVLQIDGRE